MAAIKGPAPKPPGMRARANKDTLSPTRTIKSDGKLRGPRLPKDVVWCERTLKWWENWRRSPQAQLMEPTDWDAMIEAALVHNAIHSDPAALTPTALVSMTKELHRILSPYGMSYVDRLKLRIRIDSDEPSGDTTEEKPKASSNIRNAYREQLGAT